jgi:uncharacterized protein RhaS with RHS repeats
MGYANSSDLISARYGTKGITSSSDQNGPFQSFQVNEDCSVNKLTDTNGNSVKSKYNLPSTLKSGVVITPQPDDVEFKTIGLSSGSVIGHYSENA